MTVVTVFVFATLFTAAVAIGLQYYFSHSMARNAAAELYKSTAESVASELQAIGRVNTNVVNLLAGNQDLVNRENEAAALDIFTQVLELNPMIYGAYVGHSDGYMYQVVNLQVSELARKELFATPTDHWVVIRVENTPEGWMRSYEYLDTNGRRRTSRSEPTDYQVTSRPWYRSAYESGKVETSAPYLFAHLGVPGRSISRRIAGSEAVVGLDMTMATTSKFLATREMAGDSTIYLYDTEGTVVASSVTHKYGADELRAPRVKLTGTERAYLEQLPTLRVSNETNWPPFDYTQEGQPRGYSIDTMNLIARMLQIEIEYVNGMTWTQLVDTFKAGDIDLLHSVTLTEQNKDWGLPGEPYIRIPYALLTREGEPPLKRVAHLGKRTLAIPAGWSILEVVRANHPEIPIVEVASTLEAVEKVANGEVYAALDNEVILRYLTRHYFVRGIQYHENIDLDATKVPDKLHVVVAHDKPELRVIIDKAIAAIDAENLARLEATWLKFDSQLDESTSESVPAELLVEIANTPAMQDQLHSAQLAGRDHVVFSTPIAAGTNGMLLGIVTPLDTVMAPYLEKVRLSMAITVGLLLLILPLSWLFANPIVKPVRQLAMENDKVRRREFDSVVRIPSRVKELDELSESMVGMVGSIQEYEEAQRELMDAFIRLIAEAIDEKSPYTGGHCERVPELALMLAKRAADSDAAPFDQFHPESEDEWREYRIAAWLHDCGKITTPEHIVDKGSKLETIYNRIHEVRMRFEVLWRDAEVDYWQQRHANPEQEAALAEQLAATHHQLQDDFEFVAKCNVGGEFLGDEAQARLKTIAQKSWTRNFDDRAGLSPVEELNLKGKGVPTPATEALLADKAEHIVERTRSTDYDPKLGINMDIPEHLYNQGEVYNLSISRGTLTAEDRFKINEHMISTIRMLESLPFPEELSKVPRYASTHHETMRGSGYPRKLPGEELSIPERILAVADVFEALTASDRPYKKAKPVSVAVDILHKMVEDNHIDRDCFELFIREGVYMEYAEAYLAPEQIDKVEIGKYLSH
ncbi:transporter substrate-binding domain-containing protein [Halioglobus maricola]|uniref:Transporter substrate-binding domain-containing protein n=2 Tax=Halioglobus maricola TaxID=2601894 RepID=A0A5P9NPK5_9GAMM|nr:transporter substrate-binding domain-containing protein [Halioglobus maricola]